MPPVPYHDLATLTPGEKLWLWRYRQDNRAQDTIGRVDKSKTITQREAARRLRVPAAVYRNFELDKKLQLLTPQANQIRPAISNLTKLPPHLGELCLLARRRNGYPVPLLADLTGMTPSEYRRVERWGHPRVTRYFSGAGFRFPGTRQPARP